MNYKLYIHVGTWKLADFGQDKPAINFQSNNLSELKDRQSNYSQNLKLPKTPNNRIIFQMSDDFNVLTDFQYDKHPCRLFANDYLIAGDGAFLVVNRITDFFEVQIISGISDFFQLLDVPMSDIDLGSIIRNQAATNPANFLNYKFAAATFIKGGAPIFQTDLQHNYPFVNFKYAIEKLITDKGYTLETNLSDGEWNDMYLSLCSDVSNFDEYFGQAEKYTYYENATAYPINKNVDLEIIDSADGQLITSGSSIKYSAKFEASVKLDIDLKATNTTSTSLLVRIFEAGSFITIYGIDAPVHSVSLDIKLTPTQLLDVVINLGIPAHTTATIDSSVTFKIQPSPVPFNEKLPFNINLGFAKQSDLFKAFTQMFGLTYAVDYKAKKVYGYTMQRIVDKKTDPTNWSEKYNDKGYEVVHFLTEYAQNNAVKMLNNESDDVTDSFTMPSQNELLQAQKDLIVLPFEAGIDGYVSGQYVANIPIEQITDTDIILQGGKPHLVRISGSTISFSIGSSSYNYQIAKHVKMFELQGYYSHIAKMIFKPKMIEANFLLTDKDVSELNQFKPIYIQKFGAYFYLNKVINYISGQLTKCQLIKL